VTEVTDHLIYVDLFDAADRYVTRMCFMLRDGGLDWFSDAYMIYVPPMSRTAWERLLDDPV
jgi:hypothetical protein